MKLTILGCGTSSGVPRIDGDWGACDPHEPRNRRRRVSIMVEHGATRILVDTSPDLRAQLIDEGGGAPTTVIWTHEHADHCHGIDDLRPFYFASRTSIAGYARPRTRAELLARFDFVFAGREGYPPYMTVDALPDTVQCGEIFVQCAELPHGTITSAGLRFDAGGKSIAYFTDFNGLTEPSTTLLEGLDVWVVDAVRHRPHPTHPHLAQTLEWISQFAPRRAILTHMDQSMDYATLTATLPQNVEPGYDNMVVVL